MTAEMVNVMWWVLVLRGILAILFGLGTIFWPGLSLSMLILFFGITAIVDGIFTIFGGVGSRKAQRSWWINLLQGLIGIIFGVLVLVWPEITGLVLLYLIAFWAVVVGLAQMIGAFAFGEGAGGKMLYLFSGLLAFLFGLMLLALSPVAGALVLARTIGFFAVFFGVSLIFMAFDLKNVSKELGGLSSDAVQDQS